MLIRHLAPEALTIVLGRAVDLQPLEARAYMHEGFHVGLRHAAGTQHTDHLGIRFRQISDSNAAVGTDARELGQPIVEDRERLTALGVGEEDQARVPGLMQYSGCERRCILLVDDGLHADGEIAAGRAPRRCSPMTFRACRDHDVGARLARRRW
jgi:hypothetical protein